MSAEVLRRAAALMRERAEAATPGRWVRSGSSIETDHECSPDHDCWPVGDTYSGMKPDGSTYPRDLNRADADHIASWHPAVALAVAKALDDVAQAWEICDGWATDPDDDEIPFEDTIDGGWVAVARVYLGEQS